MARKNLSKLMKKTEIRRKQLLVTSASARRSIHFRSFVVRSQVFGQSGRSYRLSLCRAKITWFGCFCFYSEDAKTFLMKSEENSNVKKSCSFAREQIGKEERERGGEEGMSQTFIFDVSIQIFLSVSELHN